MTELIWDGKYKDGKKIAPVRIALPFQTIETVNESAEDRKRSLDMFAQNKPTEWRNRLIWGDKKYVLPSLLPEFAGKVNLIYIDPPFDTGADFSFTASIPDHPGEEDQTTSFVKEPSIIEQKAYRDTWGRGLDSYLQWLQDSIVMFRELLGEDGCIYVHLDWHVAQYAKVLLDEVFGYENFVNEIIWKRKGGSANPLNRFGIVTDTLLLYSKSEEYTFVPQVTRTSEETKNYIDERFKNQIGGRKYMLAPIERNAALGIRKNLIYEYNGYTPRYGWMVSKEKLKKMDGESKLHWNSQNKPNRRVFLDEYKGQPIENLWSDIYVINPMAEERVNYPTQKPEALLQRILAASSNEGDLVLDCFCGSGTTAAVAEKLNRRWITCDLGRFAIHTTRKRLLQIANVTPFVVQNLGKYERQAWASAEFPNPEDRASQEKAYRNFIIELYQGQPITGHSWLHGVKAGRMVHVGQVDAPVALGDVKSIIQEFWRAVGKDKDIKTNGVDVLGWDFAFEINETASQMAAANKVDLKFKKIPREVLEKKAVEQGDVHFYELAALDVKAKTKGKLVELALKDFIVPPDDVPEDVRKAIVHWSQWIDYWAVDWNYRDDTFHNEWQTYRTKKNPKIDLSTKHEYESAGKYTVVVKVIDILGNDTTKAIQVEAG